MSRSNDEFLGRLDFVSRLRELETRLDRLERHTPGDDSAPTTEAGEGQTLQGVPPVRNINAQWHDGAPLSTEARPGHVLPLDAQGNVDYRRSGGTVFANRITAGYSDNTAIMDGVDTTYRFWVGASAAASAPFAVTQTGTTIIKSGSIILGTASPITLSDTGVLTAVAAFSSCGHTYVGIAGSAGYSAGVVFYSGFLSPLWLTYYNSVSGCDNQYAIYSYNTTTNLFQMSLTGASARLNMPTAFYDGHGASQIADIAGSGIALKQNAHLTADKKLIYDTATGSVYQTYVSSTSTLQTALGGSVMEDVTASGFHARYHAQFDGFVRMPFGSTLTLSSSAVTVTRSAHFIATEGGAAAGNCTTINGGVDGALLVLSTVTSTQDVTLVDGGNLSLNGNFVMDNLADRIWLHYHGALGTWFEIARSSNA